MSRQEQVRELHGRGLRNVDIAIQLGIATSTVSTFLSRSRKAEAMLRSDDVDQDDVSPRASRARVQAEVAEGKRCRVCWLLLPCADHQP